MIIPATFPDDTRDTGGGGPGTYVKFRIRLSDTGGKKGLGVWGAWSPARYIKQVLRVKDIRDRNDPTKFTWRTIPGKISAIPGSPVPKKYLAKKYQHDYKTEMVWYFRKPNADETKMETIIVDIDHHDVKPLLSGADIKETPGDKVYVIMEDDGSPKHNRKKVGDEFGILRYGVVAESDVVQEDSDHLVVAVGGENGEGRQFRKDKCIYWDEGKPK